MGEYATKTRRPPIQGLGDKISPNPTTHSKPLPARGKPSARRPNRLKVLGKAAKGIAGKQVLGTLAKKAASRATPYAAVALTAFDAAAAIKEGIGAYKAYKHLKATEKHVSEKYGSKEKATRTRKAMRSK